METTIACVYRPGNGFTDEYVHRLQADVARHCDIPYRFVCLTTELAIEGVECISLNRGNIGYWSKLELFRKGLFAGRVVYFDLDSMIVDNITSMVDYPHIFTAANNIRCDNKFADEKILNSGFMAWDAGLDLSHLDIKVTGRIIRDYSESGRRWGDQGYIQDHLGFDFDCVADIFPGAIASYKYQVKRRGLLPGERVVAFHGKPRPHEIGWDLSNG